MPVGYAMETTPHASGAMASPTVDSCSMNAESAAGTTRHVQVATGFQTVDSFLMNAESAGEEASPRVHAIAQAMS